MGLQVVGIVVLVQRNMGFNITHDPVKKTKLCKRLNSWALSHVLLDGHGLCKRGGIDAGLMMLTFNIHISYRP